MPTNPANRKPQPTNLPREVGGYEIQRVLGTGGMATVYAALQKQPRRTVAIKVMSGAINAESAMHRFKREIEILGRLRHPYIAQVYAAGVHEDGGLSLPYFVMEYVPGARTIIAFAEGRELNVRERLKLFIKVCAAVEHGHRHKIIHRDLKPGNILIDEVGEPKVIDFGVARAVEPDVTSQTMHTEEGRLIGTLQYMAPEQLETTRQDLDARCDVYALGVLLYKLLTGRMPHDLVGLPVFTAAQVIREDIPPRPSTIRSEIKGDVETIILRALAKDKSRRYANAGSLARDLIRFLAAKPIKAREASRLYRASLFLRRHRSETRAAAVVAVVVIAALAAIVWQRRSLGPRRSPPPAVAAATPTGTDPAPGPPSTPPRIDRNGGDAGSENDLPDSFALGSADDVTTALAFDAAGLVLAQATGRLQIRWWDFETEETLFTTTDHAEAVQHLAFSGDGSRLASASSDGVVMVLERDGNKTDFVTPRTEFAGMHAMTLDTDGATMAIASDDLTLRIVATDGKIRHILRATRGAFHAVGFSHDGRMVAAGSVNGDVYVWNTGRGGEPDRYAGLQTPVVGLGFTAGNDHVVAVTESGNGMIWPLAGGGSARGQSFVVDVDLVKAVSFDASGGWVACASADLVQIFAIPSGDLVENVEAPDDARIATIALFPEAYWVAIGHELGGVDAMPVAARWTAD